MKNGKARKIEQSPSVEPADTPPLLKLQSGGSERTFDIDNPELPDWLTKRTLTSGGYPYDEKMPREEYDETLERLQVELVKLQSWMQTTGRRVLILLEGRDAAGKGGVIKAIREYMNPRTARNVALPKPTETEQGQWYYQRYVAQFPTSGELVTFDRSWYNRAGVEPVMGFCTPEQHAHFLDETPGFERMIVNEGIHLFKFWLDLGREMQLKRFHDRRHSPLTCWDACGEMRDLMLERTHTAHAPWIVVRSNDKRRARIAAIRRVLANLPYTGRDLAAIGKADPKIIGEGPGFLKG
jgi:polyphosphate kinase